MRATTGVLGRARRKHRTQPWAATVVALLVLLVCIPVVLAQMLPPAVVSETAPNSVFSAMRALRHLRHIARAPHPTGSPESRVVRQYLADQLALLGLEAQVQADTSVYLDTGAWGVAGARGLETTPDTWSLAGASVHNVMARIPGTANTGAIVLLAHYDSVPYGPGASDDGAGVAAILEVARALRAGPALRNDVILLFTDGEEIGLLGSQAFARHPWMEEAAVVLNLEARGSSGAVVMYETSPHNAWLVEQYARAAHAPVTSSLATDVWRRMPNSSDLTVFLASGKQGLNFAYVENWTDYHTTHDSLADLDVRSLQHHGANALSLTRHFGSLDLRQRTETDAIFFSVLGLGVVRYPQAWAVPLTAGGAVAAVWVLLNGLRRRRLSGRGLAGGVLACMVAAGSAALVTFLLVQALNAVKGGELSVGMGGTYEAHLYELGLLLLDLVIAGGVYAVFQRRFGSADLAGGVLLIWLLLTSLTTWLLPGGSYLFLWPLAAGLITLTAFLSEREDLSRLARGLVVVPGIVGLVVAGGAVYLVQRLFGAAILPAGAVFIVLLLALVFPYLQFAVLPAARAWAGGFALIGLALLFTVGLTTPYSADQPRQNFLFHSQDADAGTAAWVAKTKLPDATLSPWLGDVPQEAVLRDYFPAAWDDPVFVQAGPVSSQPAPELSVLADRLDGGVRRLRLALHSPRQAWALLLEVSAEDALLAAEVYGERHASATPRDSMFLKLVGVPAEGVELALDLRPGVPLAFRLGDVSPGWPALGEQADLILTTLRTGYGGGHGIDGMSLIHRRYTFK